MRRLFIACLLSLAWALPGHALTLKIATVAPDGTPWMEAMKTAAREIKQRTQGRVKLRFFPGGVMGDDRTVLRKMRIGQLHGGAFTNGGMALAVPEANLYSIPFLFRDRTEVASVRARFDQELIERLERAGLVAFRFSDGGFAHLMSRAPIRGPADLKGRKAWIPPGDPIAERAFQTLGVAPVALPITDVLTGLQTGLIDTIVAPFAGAVALQWHTRVRYVTDYPLSYVFNGLLFSKKALRRVKAEDLAVMREVITRLSDQLSQRSWEDEASARTALQRQGLQFVAMDDATVGELRQRLLAEMARLGESGAFDPDLLRRIQAHLDAQRRDGGR